MEKLTLKYDPLTIKHLGVSLYSQLPSVLSELVSNAYDADSSNIEINLLDDGTNKEIHIKDDGHGMSYDELNAKYLMIGRNRRSESDNQFSASKKRRVIGKKGLGKLSVFGVCREAIVRTVKDGIENKFSMDLDEIEKSKGTYHPEILIHSRKTDQSSGTEIWLKKVKRKSAFDQDSIAKSLAKKFTIFHELGVKLSLNGSNHISLRNEMKFEGLNKEFGWKFPSAVYGKNYTHWNDIKGEIITLKTPVKDTEMKGIYLTSRGKIVNNAEFYGLRDNDQFHEYITGYLSIDFIDELGEDIIGTDRHSLIWENDTAAELREYLQNVIRQIQSEWKKKRAAAKADDIKNIGGKDIHEWKSSLPTYERNLADKIINPVLEDANISTEKSTEIIEGIIEKFDNQTFKEYASNLADICNSQDIPKYIQLMNEWKVIETREMSALATARIEVINNFEKLLESDTKEVPTLHDFLKKFPWLLDPRILEFEDEITYSKLLKNTYPEKELDEKDRRIDFLCSNALGGILYVIEIKRSLYKVDKKAIEQAYEYGSFLKENYASQGSFSNVVCYVVGGSKSSDHLFRSKETTYSRSGEVFVKTYRELLEQSKKFHREFIEAHKAHTKASV